VCQLKELTGSNGMVAYRMRCINMQVNHNYCHGNNQNELDTTLFDKVCLWVSMVTPVSAISKIDNHDITDIDLKVA
jgi:hypothetical protein